jgi:hypothetical protein
VSTLEEGNNGGRIVAIQSLSNAQLIQILQHHDDEKLTQMIEEELAGARLMARRSNDQR